MEIHCGPPWEGATQRPTKEKRKHGKHENAKTALEIFVAKAGARGAKLASGKERPKEPML